MIFNRDTLLKYRNSDSLLKFILSDCADIKYRLVNKTLEVNGDINLEYVYYAIEMMYTRFPSKKIEYLRIDLGEISNTNYLESLKIKNLIFKDTDIDIEYDIPIERIEISDCYIRNINLTSSKIKGVQISNCGEINLSELPENLEMLVITWSNIKTLPKLPNTLKYLYVQNCGLKELPELPEGLKRLELYGNKLKRLPALPDGLKKLDCSNNRLTELPELPYGLKELFCHKNDGFENWILPRKFNLMNDRFHRSE